jgi:phosphinothricin acetyltransferase
MPKVRPASDSDITVINEIYNYFVEHSNVTLDVELRSETEGMNWLRQHKIAVLPVMVAEVNDVVEGWFSLSKLSDKSGYKTSAEISIYVSPGSQRKGIGKNLFETALRKAKGIGLHCIVARISSGNETSINFFERNGFNHAGIEKEVGLKFNKFVDVVVMQRLLISAL